MRKSKGQDFSHIQLSETDPDQARLTILHEVSQRVRTERESRKCLAENNSNPHLKKKQAMAHSSGQAEPVASTETASPPAPIEANTWFDFDFDFHLDTPIPTNPAHPVMPTRFSESLSHPSRTWEIELQPPPPPHATPPDGMIEADQSYPVSDFDFDAPMNILTDTVTSTRPADNCWQAFVNPLQLLLAANPLPEAWRAGPTGEYVPLQEDEPMHEHEQFSGERSPDSPPRRTVSRDDSWTWVMTRPEHVSLREGEPVHEHEELSGQAVPAVLYKERSAVATAGPSDDQTARVNTVYRNYPICEKNGLIVRLRFSSTNRSSNQYGQHLTAYHGYQLWQDDQHNERWKCNPCRTGFLSALSRNGHMSSHRSVAFKWMYECRYESCRARVRDLVCLAHHQILHLEVEDDQTEVLDGRIATQDSRVSIWQIGRW